MTTLDEWIAEVSTQLDIDPASVDLKAVLDLARDAAHNVERPAAPLTTYMVGYAAGLAAGQTLPAHADHRGVTAPTAFARATALSLAQGSDS
ncbi:hypothetical protein SAMN04489860_2663 [Paraoerskovia marina]|uniref:DUF6457 domain-containing protein n=1 Tax=Paraoerskovia marina TaxID=545619 RepID=A0A1H1W120_9CELL|nr:DUF6457 domain-containing protein [Paraoerskovia marina]SDS90196.1 hypothetical protein SAMN04489860_2663 [Paraoerskovia marina]